MQFDLHIGIDYSGRETPTSRTPALQVYAAFDAETPRAILSPAHSEKAKRNWNRKEIAAWLIQQAHKNVRFVAGIDHGFSFPWSYFQRYRLTSWPEFLDDFCEHWPTDLDHTYVDFLRYRPEGPPDRTGSNGELRITEQWTSSAKSVFQFDVQGSVAKSTYAGLPWLRRIRQEAGDRIHFWPFDGWNVPAGKSLLAEMFPSIFRNRYPREGRTADQQDAYCVARWLAESDQRASLPRYLDVPLTDNERTRGRPGGLDPGNLLKSQTTAGRGRGNSFRRGGHPCGCRHRKFVRGSGSVARLDSIRTLVKRPLPPFTSAWKSRPCPTISMTLITWKTISTIVHRTCWWSGFNRSVLPRS